MKELYAAKMVQRKHKWKQDSKKYFPVTLNLNFDETVPSKRLKVVKEVKPRMKTQVRDSANQDSVIKFTATMKLAWYKYRIFWWVEMWMLPYHVGKTLQNSFHASFCKENKTTLIAASTCSSNDMSCKFLRLFRLEVKYLL